MSSEHDRYTYLLTTLLDCLENGDVAEDYDTVRIATEIRLIADVIRMLFHSNESAVLTQAFLDDLRGGGDE